MKFDYSATKPTASQLDEAKKEAEQKTTALSKQAIVNTALSNRMPSAGGDSLAVPSQSGWGASN